MFYTPADNVRSVKFWTQRSARRVIQNIHFNFALQAREICPAGKMWHVPQSFAEIPTTVPRSVPRRSRLRYLLQCVHRESRQHSKRRTSTLAAQCRPSARRAIRLVACYLEAAGSVTHEPLAFTRVELSFCRLQGSLPVISSDTLRHLKPVSVFQAAYPHAAAKFVAQLLLQFQRSLVAPTMVQLKRLKLDMLTYPIMMSSTLFTFSYRSSSLGCLWNEVWRLLSCCEAHTDGQS